MTRELTLGNPRSVLVHEYSNNTRIVDCSGFGSPEYPSELLCQDLSNNFPRIDLLIYCNNFNIRRFTDKEISALKYTVQAFSPDTWNRDVSLFTFTDLFVKRAKATIKVTENRFEALTRHISTSLIEAGVSENTIRGLPYLYSGIKLVNTTALIQDTCLKRSAPVLRELLPEIFVKASC